MGVHCGHHHHGPDLSETQREYRRLLLLVAVLNGLMFLTEMLGGHLADSRALQADALDFMADTLTYGVSLWAVGKSLNVRTNAALLKGTSMLAGGLFVAFITFKSIFGEANPEAPPMGIIGFLALLVNVASVLLLWKFKNGDANIRSAWLCSRNDAFNNVAVIGAAGLVAWTGRAWPDLLVAAGMAALALYTAVEIITQALREKRRGKATR